MYPASAFPSATNRAGGATGQTDGGRPGCYSPPMGTVRIEHVALWTDDVDRLASFYARYFDARIGDAYRNDAEGFESRFVEFDEAGAFIGYCGTGLDITQRKRAEIALRESDKS